MKKILFIFLTILLLGNCKQENDTIKIGIILPLTGDVATYGKSVKKGIDIAIENENTISIKPFYEDSKANKIASINALESLFARKINFFIGDATSTVTYEIGPRIQKEDKILIVPIATGDKISKIGKNVFMISPRNEKQTLKIINFINNEFKNKKIGCLFKQNDYGVNIANTFFHEFPDIFSQAYQEGQNDFKTILNKFIKENVEIIFVPGNYEETAKILKQSREINYNPIYIGTDGCYSPKLIELAGNASENFLLTIMPVDYNSEMYRNFEKLFYNKFNSKPDIFSCYGYESAIILINSLKNSVDRTSSEISNYLLSNSFKSLTGEIDLRFDNNGEAERNYQIYIVKDGNFIPY